MPWNFIIGKNQLTVLLFAEVLKEPGHKLHSPQGLVLKLDQIPPKNLGDGAVVC